MNYIHRDLVPLWEKYGVSAVLNGHDHTLEHYFVQGIHYGEFSSFGNTYGIGNHPEPHEQTAAYEESLVRGFLWAQVTPDSIKCQVIQGGYKEPGAGTILHEFSIKPKDISSMTEEPETKLGQFALFQSYPNPFNPSTVIAYQLGKGGHIELIIFDVTGRKVRTLVNDNQQAGRQYIHWDGSNDSGETVSSGIYFYRLKAGEYQETRKMNFLR